MFERFGLVNGKKKRKKIEHCLKDYLTTLSGAEKTLYREEIAPLAEIIRGADDDEEIIAQARDFDAEHGTEIMEQAVKLTIYCIACHKFNCTC